MPFSIYKNIGTVAKEFQVKYIKKNFILELEFPIPAGFKEELDLLLSEGVVNNSEAAICENLIYPILKEIWKKYLKRFTLWSHEVLFYDEKLSGIPDYILAKRSPLGTLIFDKPYFLAVEAKQDKFREGWGQCLAEMIAIQKINNNPEQVIYGTVSNGRMWQFGKLNNSTFIENDRAYLIEDLERLFAAVNYVFKQCEMQLEPVEI